MTDSKLKPDVIPRRLCGEIQLFDLCELASCVHKSGGFCTNPLLLDRFEKIAENELRVPERHTSEGIDDAEADDVEGEFVMEDFESDEDDGFEDE